jgi:hypothetical protein
MIARGSAFGQTHRWVPESNKTTRAKRHQRCGRYIAHGRESVGRRCDVRGRGHAGDGEGKSRVWRRDTMFNYHTQTPESLVSWSMNNWFDTYERVTGGIIQSHLRSALPATIQDAMARPAPPHFESRPAISLYHGSHRCSGLNARERGQGRWSALTVCRRSGHEMFRIPQRRQGRSSRPWIGSQYRLMQVAHYSSQKRVRVKEMPTTRTWSQKHGWRLAQCACE